MSTLDFVPRSLKRKTTATESTLSTQETQSSTGPPSKAHNNLKTDQTKQPSPSIEAKHAKGPRPQKKNQEQNILPSWDFAFLVWLALSDYSIWVDGDLRRRLEDASARPAHTGEVVDQDKMDLDEAREEQNERGFVPLTHLFQHSPVFRLVSNSKPYCDVKESIYVNSLRQFAKDVIDVRFIVDPTSTSARTKVISRRSRQPQTGYEVRRTELSSLNDSVCSQYNKANWDTLTVYAENIPVNYAKVSGIGQFISALLPNSSILPIKRVQNIVVPPHHQDLPDSIPICKGFALVTLSSEEAVQTLLHAWPWDSEKSANLNQADMSSSSNRRSAEENAAKTSGLRICTKARWEQLRVEYLRYRQQLIDEIDQTQEKEDLGGIQKEDTLQQDRIASGSKRKQPESTNQYEVGIRRDSPYPTGCLASIRHIHPETNKTTLRKLFSQACQSQDENAIDYVDYTKKMDSCHIRFATPAQAEYFVDYFLSHNIAQLSGLDIQGSESSSSEIKAIVPEIILGKREEFYWEKVPEKNRKQAVERALKAIHGPNLVGAADERDAAESPQRGKRRRKRGFQSDAIGLASDNPTV